jgi:hypothetical protein
VTTELDLPENTLALHLLLEHFQRLVDIVVADENLHERFSSKQLMGLAVIGWLGCLSYFGQGTNPSCSAHQRKLFAASPVSWSVDAVLTRRRIALRVAGRGQPISAENTSTLGRSNERNRRSGKLQRRSNEKFLRASLLSHFPEGPPVPGALLFNGGQKSIPPMPPPPDIAGGCFFGGSATIVSVVISKPAIEAAPCNAARSTRRLTSPRDRYA